MTVQVSVIAPDEQNSIFEGYIRVENQNNPGDFDLISVYLKTPVNNNVLQLMIYQFILKIRHSSFERIYNLFKHLI